MLFGPSDERVMKTVPLGGDADNVRYDTAAKQFFVGTDRGRLPRSISMGVERAR